MVGHQPTLKKGLVGIGLGNSMAEKKNILYDDLIYIIDKKSGEKFLKQYSRQLCEISHYKIKSKKY